MAQNRSTEEVVAAFIKSRGKILPYQRVLAEYQPELLASFNAFYTNLILSPRDLTLQERELVWTALVTATREEVGRIHLQRGIDAGLTPEDLTDAIALAAAGEAYSAIEFATNHWQDWMSRNNASEHYGSIIASARGSIEAYLAEVILVVCFAARHVPDGLRFHLRRAFEQGATQGQIAEGLSYLIMPCGANTLIEAVDVWLEAAEAGECPPPFTD
jgi:alkylhydroperoxidase/carboxymuconolactone decarboxylase family protein YurZ